MPLHAQGQRRRNPEASSGAQNKTLGFNLIFYHVGGNCLIAAPAASWHEAAEKARYLLNLFSKTLAAEDPRRQKLIAVVLDDFERLARES